MANKITGTYRNGSSGDEVRQIQQKLIDGEYLGKGQDDGIFGAKTADAVKLYQKDNNLAVDGIVGKNTLASLFGSNTGTETTKPTQAAPAQTATPATTPAATATPTEPAAPVTSPAGFTYGDFSYAAWNPQDDPTIQQANALLQQHMSNPVGEYKPVWQDEADAYLSQYQNRDPFSYDFNSDALYNQYKDQYIQQGKMAMMDTMGQAAALTGGYGNSYAQTVGQQAYNQQLNQLNEIMPELYGMAYDRYNKEGQDLLDMYGMYMDREALAYGQHQDSLNNWYKQLDYLTDNYNTAYDRGYNNYLLGYENAWNEYSTDRAEEFEKYQNSINQQFTASENEKDRVAAAAKAAATGTKGTLDTQDTLTWIKRFEGAESLDKLEEYTTALQGIIGPEAAAVWFDTYADKFRDEQGGNEPPLAPLTPSGVNSDSYVRTNPGGVYYGKATRKITKDKVMAMTR